jgi:hypothetical protein
MMYSIAIPLPMPEKAPIQRVVQLLKREVTVAEQVRLELSAQPLVVLGRWWRLTALL